MRQTKSETSAIKSEHIIFQFSVVYQGNSKLMSR